MKKLFTLALVVGAILTGCCKYDICDLHKEIDDLELRVAALEEWQQTVNTNIGALQTLLAALDAKDFVTGVSPVTDSGAPVGYTIIFTKSPAITIRHGEDGAAGTTPQIGVKQHTDGKYYWTLDGG